MPDTTPAAPPAPPTTATTIQTAPDAGTTAAVMGPDVMQFLPLVAIFAIFYFLIIRPQQKRQRDHQDAMKALKKGDRIVTGGGIIGTVVAAPEGNTEITVDLNDTTRVSVLRSTVSHVINPTPANDDAQSKLQTSEKSA